MLKLEAVVLIRPDGTQMNARLFLPEAVTERVPAVLVIFDVFGMTADLDRIAARFVDEGYAVIIPDLFDRPEPRLFCVVRALRSSVRGKGREYQDIELARDYLAARPEVDSERIAITGFCMGGGFAIILAARKMFKVSAPFYGDVPKDTAALRGSCPLVASYGERDSAAMVKAGKRLQSCLEQLGVPHDVKFYREAGHSFMNRNTGFLAKTIAPHLPMHAEYHHESAEDAWHRVFSFFQTHL
jgi:carboxymethylenebutenolidase